MPPELHFDLAKIDLTRIEADKEAIRAVLPQRFEMEQLDVVLFTDRANHLIVGYKDVRADEFWVRGHLPGYPLMPGVLMCEASAQLASYFIMKYHLSEGEFIGFGGLEEVRFRSPVRPGDRLMLVGKGIKVHRRKTVFNVQGFVNETMVFHGDVIGMPIPKGGESPP